MATGLSSLLNMGIDTRLYIDAFTYVEQRAFTREKAINPRVAGQFLKRFVRLSESDFFKFGEH